jgi:predicted pyridoxine 5'-phosphate oxidase superfamily flavin-nucleotide-binding protein
MSKLYGVQHRKLQDKYDTRKLADAVEKVIVQNAISEQDKAFIESRDMLFLSTVDHLGRPSVSYKGGARGFVKVIDQDTLAIPSYDGNGMFLSLGNIDANNKVGLLFIDFENPYRLRAYGEASISSDDALLESYHEAQEIVRIRITEIWKNCPRYVHRYARVEESKYVPKVETETPLPDWKRLDKLQDILPPGDRGKAEKQGGLLSLDELQKIEQRMVDASAREKN